MFPPTHVTQFFASVSCWNHSCRYLALNCVATQRVGEKWGTCSQQLWLHSSVGRALHRYRRGHGFDPAEGLLFRNCLNCVSTAKIIHNVKIEIAMALGASIPVLFFQTLPPLSTPLSRYANQYRLYFPCNCILFLSKYKFGPIFRIFFFQNTSLVQFFA